MIVHLLRFKFKNGVSEDDKRRVLRLISTNTNRNAVEFSFAGQDLGDPAEGYTHAYCAGLKDLAALESYINDPLHTEGDFFILPLLEKMASVDMSDDLDPQLGEKIYEIHRRKMAANPDWAQLLKQIPEMKIDG